MRAMSAAELASIEPFNLKDLLEFSPDFLAGWTALTYDESLAEASLRARELVVKKMRRTLPAKVEVTHEKRNFRTGGGKWSGMTFKHVLLPLYVGAYTYRGKPYRVLVNGQTGKVGGAKPRDTFKVALVILLVLVGLAVLIAVLWSLLNPSLG
jgi:hypothetical protein